ncbi:hypothetical protein [Nocardia sp. NPDC004604]|uniref:hypothetical protein n=1 Tax=Nocardia sp. NPDC004604 TaxID=3157013 RepID=UPI0033A403F2
MPSTAAAPRHHNHRRRGEWGGAAPDGLPVSTFVEAFSAHMDEERQRTLEARLEL